MVSQSIKIMTSHVFSLLFCIWRPVNSSSGGEPTLEMKQKTVASFESGHYTQFEDTIKTPITDYDVTAAMTTETTISAEGSAEDKGTYTGVSEPDPL